MASGAQGWRRPPFFCARRGDEDEEGFLPSAGGQTDR
jgi:hypothetical protein